MTRFEEQHLLQKAFELADKRLAAEAIDPRDFIDLYGEPNVQADLAYVARSVQEHAQRDAREERGVENKQMAAVIEAITGDGIGLYDWAGSRAHFIVPAKYDDIRNRTDGLIEIEEDRKQASHIGLALDATFSGDTGKKVQGIESSILENDPFRMKYFRSDILTIRGELSNVPRAVFALERETIRSLAVSWLGKDKKALTEHWVQHQLLEQFITQCEVFAKIAVRRPELSNRYDHAREQFIAIRKERLQVVPDDGTRDGASARLFSSLDALRRR